MMLPGPSSFPTTRWTLVVAAANANSEQSRAALATLCERYWNPLYVYLRRRGFSPDESQDLTQEFFVRILEGRYLERADRERGRFRSFLLTSLKFMVSDQKDHENAAKRGGGMLIPLDFAAGEESYHREPADDETPDRIFERRWALTVIDHVLEGLRSEFEQQGRADYFDRVKVFLLGRDAGPYTTVAAELNTSEGALKVAIHRLRKRYRDLFRQEIADTVADPADVDAELRYLANVLSKS